MKNFNLKQNISDANASGREYSFAPWNNYNNASFNSKEILQNGRSMIEMLGVLAIIGVLSVGGIAGYSKAMMKYRINKTIEQITLIAGNVRTFFAPQKNYNGLDQKNVIKKAKLVPDEMWNSEKTGLIAVWGNDFYIRSTWKNGNDHYGAFYLGMDDVPTEACIELVSQDWSALDSNIIIESDEDNTRYTVAPVDLETAIKMCKDTNSDGATSELWLYIGVDVNSDYWQGILNPSS